MLKAIVFDFDGVILESIEVKKEAFRRLFEDSEHVDAIVQYHMDHGGVSRFRKFDYIYTHFLKQPLTEERREELGRLFREYALQGVLDAAFVDGAKEFLQKHHGQVDLFVASGTPHEEMLDVVEQRGLEPYFRQVFGSPAGKADILRTIMQDYGVAEDDMLFVGDAMTDYDGAKEASVPFVGRVHPVFGNPFAGLEVRALIGDLRELDQLIEQEFSIAT